MTQQKILGRGAEAIIFLEKDKVIKDRIKKSYRIPELDKQIRKLRTRAEGKILEKASKIISVPKVFKTDEKEKKLIIEFIDGKKISDSLDSFPLKEQKEICKKIGNSVGKLHDSGIVHGDLTTSNMILKDKKVYFIDFGLSFNSPKYEDRAVDLHLLKQALEAKHFAHWEILFKEVISEYKKTSKEAEKTLIQFIKVEKRGRYKEHQLF